MTIYPVSVAIIIFFFTQKDTHYVSHYVSHLFSHLRLASILAPLLASREAYPVLICQPRRCILILLLLWLLLWLLSTSPHQERRLVR